MASQLEQHAKRLGIPLQDLKEKSADEFRAWSKTTLESTVLEHAALYREWRNLKQEETTTIEINSLADLCKAADASTEDLVLLSDDDFNELSRIVGNTRIKRNLKRKSDAIVVTPEKKKPPAKKPRTALKATKNSSNVEDLICKAIHILCAFSSNDPSPHVVALLAGFTNSGSASYRKALKNLRDAEKVELKALRLTPEAINSLPPPVFLPRTNAEMQALLRAKLGDKQGQMFEILKDGEVHALTEVGKEMKYGNIQSFKFRDTVSWLSSRGLVEKPSKSSIRLTEVAYPYGRDANQEDTMLDAAAVVATATQAPEPKTKKVAKPKKATKAKVKKAPAAAQPELVASSVQTPTPVKKAPAAAQPELVASSGPTPTPAIGAGLSDMANSIWDELLELRALSICDPPRKYVAALTGYSESTKSYEMALRELKGREIIQGVSSGKVKTWRLTQQGLNSRVHVRPPKTNAEMRERLCTMLKTLEGAPSEKAEAMIQVLSDGKAHNRKQVAVAAGYSPSTKNFTKILSGLKNLGMLETPSSGMVQLTDLAFPFGKTEAQATSDLFAGAVASSNQNQNGSAQGSCLNDEDKCGVETESESEAQPDANKNDRIIPSNIKVEQESLLPNGSSSAVQHGSTPIAMSAAARKICKALVELRALSVISVPCKHILAFSEYSNEKSHGFAVARRQLKQELHFIENGDNSKTMRLTQLGMDSLEHVDKPSTNAEAHERICAIIKQLKGASPNKVDEIFQVLSDGREHSREDVADKANYKNTKSQGFATVLSILNSYDLLQTSNGKIQLTDKAFPFGKDADFGSEEEVAV